MKGKLIVIEGSDGAGKATQVDLLKEYLESNNIFFETVDFPQYQSSFYGKMIAAYLRGEYGPLEHIDPHLISAVYAMDRFQAKEKMDRWLAEGKIILANRYANSNMAHQSSRLPAEKCDNFLQWLEEMEYKVNKIPREDVVIYLHVPYQISQSLILKKSKEQRIYAEGKARDMVEENLEYVKKSEEGYLQMVKRFPHWVMIECVNEKGSLLSREDIHEEIKMILKERSFFH